MLWVPLAMSMHVKSGLPIVHDWSWPRNAPGIDRKELLLLLMQALIWMAQYPSSLLYGGALLRRMF